MTDPARSSSSSPASAASATSDPQPGPPSGPPAWAAGLGGALAGPIARLVYAYGRRRPPGGAARWERRNHRGEAVTLWEGPAVTAGSVLALATAPGLTPATRTAAAVAGLGAGAAGLIDDFGEDRTQVHKGFKGHLSALAHGTVTTGALKIALVGAAGVAAAALLPPDRPARSRAGAVTDALIGGAVVAGAANALNLFDLRPGRALKVALGASTALAAHPRSAPVAAAVSGSASAMLPHDLREEAMLGDTGANALGALLGLGVLARGGRTSRLLVLAGTTALALASEAVSFSEVIERRPLLKALDALGRRPRD